MVVRIQDKIKQLKYKVTKKRLLITAGVLVMFFVFLNLVVFAIYKNKAYPQTSIGGLAIGNKSYSEVSDTLAANPQIPSEITLRTPSQEKTIATSSLGINTNNEETITNIKNEKSLIPLIDLFSGHNVKLATSVDGTTLASQSEALAKSFSKPAKNAKISLKNGTFELNQSEEGLDITPQEMSNQILDTISAGQANLMLAGKTLAPKVKTTELDESYRALRSQQNVVLSYSYSGSSANPSPTDIGNWYVGSGNTYTLSDQKIRSYIQARAASWGITVDNLDSAVAETKESLKNLKKLSFALKGTKIVRTYTYCIDLKNVNSSYLEEFRTKLASVYADSKGWSLGGQVVFKRVSSGCQFTAWLSAASQLPSFGAICDSMWSCRVGRNVVINLERWKNASSAWNSSGGSLNDYRSMVINHETGHWLGFGHRMCPGAGKPAPVMQQQSINLQGCKFNPWPTSSELATLKATL